MGLKVVTPGAGEAAGVGRDRSGQSRTGIHSSMLATSPCYCGVGRQAGPRYVCITCAGFARFGMQIEQRAPHRYQERRSA